MAKKTTPSLSEVAYIALKKTVLNLGEGKYLSARQFARELNMSYTPVREAFLRLEREGSLELVPKVGFFVKKMDIADFIQLFQVRECLEVFVLDRSFSRITKEHISQMKEIQNLQIEKIAAGELIDYFQLDTKFHMLFFQIYGNIHLIEFYKMIREQYTICSLRIAKNLSNEAFVEHLDLIAGIESGDKDRALEVLKKHLHQAQERLTEGYINVINND